MRCTQSVVSAAAGKASLQVELGAVGGEVELPLCHKRGWTDIVRVTGCNIMNGV